MSCLDLAPFDRRAFLGSLVLSVLAVPLAAAQQAGRVYLIGFLSPSSPSDSRNPILLGALRQGLRELGYVEGQNIGIESRWAEGKYDRLPDLAAELVRLKVGRHRHVCPAGDSSRKTSDPDDPDRHGRRH